MITKVPTGDIRAMDIFMFSNRRGDADPAATQFPTGRIQPPSPPLDPAGFENVRRPRNERFGERGLKRGSKASENVSRWRKEGNRPRNRTRRRCSFGVGRALPPASTEIAHASALPTDGTEFWGNLAKTFHDRIHRHRSRSLSTLRGDPRRRRPRVTRFRGHSFPRECKGRASCWRGTAARDALRNRTYAGTGPTSHLLVQPIGETCLSINRLAL